MKLSSLKISFRSLWFYRRSYRPTLAGIFLATTILTGALMVGDSVKFSLEHITQLRLGRTQFAVTAGDRFFTKGLGKKCGNDLLIKTASVLSLNGIVKHPGSELQVNQVHILGVDEAFWEIGQTCPWFCKTDRDVVHINERLADRLNLTSGDEILIKLNQPGGMPLDAPFVSKESRRISLRLPVQIILTDEQFGRFGLEPNQQVPYNLFIRYEVLAKALGLKGRANLVLAANRSQDAVELKSFRSELDQNFRFDDVQLSMRRMKNQPGFELTSERMFIEDAVINAAVQSGVPFQRVFTYFVNSIHSHARSIPYSFVSGLDRELSPIPLKEDEICLNRWSADDLNVAVGDSVTLNYYVFSTDQILRENQAVFFVKAVLPMNGILADSTLMPHLPGLSTAGHCREWDPGMPIDLDRIRDKDEAYWNQYRGTPKAFITLTRAQALWGNRFGRCTALRFPEGDPDAGLLQKKLRQYLSIDDFGFVIRPVQEEAAWASGNAVDFGELFLGLSFFILAAALILLALLSLAQADHRTGEVACYKALGFLKGSILRMMLLENGIVAFFGVLAGSAGAAAYNQLILHALGTVWRGATSTSSLIISIRPETVILGAAVSGLISLLVLGLIINHRLKKTHAALLQSAQRADRLKTGKISQKTGLIFSIGMFAAVLSGVLLTPRQFGGSASGFFWIAGLLLILSGLLFVRSLSGLMQRHADKKAFSLNTLVRRNLMRNRLRSLGVIALLAGGVYAVVGVGANRLSISQTPLKRESGTGGFGLYGETTLPVLENLNTPQAQSDIGLKEADAGPVRFVQLRYKSGTEASCLNLNQVQQPQILGVDPETLIHPNTFSFAAVTDENFKDSPWELLNQSTGDVIPAIADLGVIIWSLGKSVGDTLTLPDETGNLLKLRLVAGLNSSIFQGSVIISNQAFIEHFPSAAGARRILVDVSMEDRENVKSTLHRFMQDYGLELVNTEDRLASFMIVQNTYLSIFLALGGFGILIGITGMGIVVSRNISERRGELAVLRAVGISQTMLQRMLLAEHLILLILGIFLGCLSGLIAVKPVLSANATEIPWLFILVLNLLILLNGGFWTALAVRSGLRGNLAATLRNE